MLLPINLQQWITEHQAFLKPPVCNRQVYPMGDFIIMVVGGPNSRKDYHDDAGEEFFYQLKGHMVLRIRENEAPKDITIREGEIFLLPPHVLHSPQRFPDSVGLVIERRRRPDEQDGFVWFCDHCNTKLHEAYLPVSDIEKDLPTVFKTFWETEAHRTCSHCGNVLQKPGAPA